MKRKKQIVALVVCFLMISFVCGLPHLIGLKMHGSDYRSFTFYSSSTSREEAYNYMVRTKLVLRGDFLLGDQHLHEYRKFPHPYTGEIVSSYVMAFLSKLVGSVDMGFIVADFIFPGIAFLLVFYLVNLIIKDWFFSIAISIATVLVRDLMMFIPYPWQTLNFLFSPSDFVDNLVITRAFHPEISFVFFLLALIFVYRLLVIGKKKDYVLSGVFCGLLFYVYVFFWTSFYFGVAIIFLINIKNNIVRKKLFILAIISLFVGSFYFIRQFQFRLSGLLLDFAFRSTGFRSEFPLPEAKRFITLSIITFLIFILIRKRKKIDKYHIYFNSLIFAGAILPDLSYIIFGKDLEAIHWIWVYVLPLSTIYYLILFRKHILSFVSLNKRFFVGSTLIFLSFFFAFKIQTEVAREFTRHQKFQREEKELVVFLNSIKGRVVVNTIISSQTFKGINMFVPVVSSHYVFVPHSGLTVAPTDEIIKRSLVALSFINKAEFVSDEQINMILGNAYSFLNASYVEKNIKLLRQEIRSANNRLVDFCHNYRMDYVLTSLTDEKKIIGNKCFLTTRVFGNNKYVVFKVKKI